MDFYQFEQMLRFDPRFAQLQASPEKLNETIFKLRTIANSRKLKDESDRFFARQRDLDRYVAIAKKIGGLRTQDHRWSGRLEDVSLITASDEQIAAVYEDDARSFYYQLDVLTNGKFNFYERAAAKLAETNFERNIARSGVGCHEENGQLVWHINVDCAPYINNRTVTMHELWHAMDEKNQNYNTSAKEQEQFAGEIGSMFIDLLSQDYIMANYSDNKQLVDGIKYLKSVKWNNDIIKAREAYLDVLTCQAFYAGSEDVRNAAQQEIFTNFGKMFGPGIIMSQIDRLYNVATQQNAHFDPMYELRYIVGEVVSTAVYNQQHIPLPERVDKMATLNDNIKTLNGIQEDPHQSPIDAVTDYLGVDNIETLVDNYAQQMIQNRENQYAQR